jgi:UDP-3-O-[3-hydroxymyristoyl] glucosamine N-acyltransferase
VAHVGGVRLENQVELQAGSLVDKSIFGGFTIVGEETKTDNKVHIAHNCRLGKRNRLAAGAMLAGSVVSGDDVWFGPMCAIADGIKVGARASITIGAVVTRDVPEDARVSGNFAIDHQRFLTHIKTIR